jgi:hypothetical protein
MQPLPSSTDGSKGSVNAENQTGKRSPKQKNGLSTKAKVALGITGLGATILTGWRLYSASNPAQDSCIIFCPSTPQPPSSLDYALLGTLATLASTTLCYFTGTGCFSPKEVEKKDATSIGEFNEFDDWQLGKFIDTKTTKMTEEEISELEKAKNQEKLKRFITQYKKDVDSLEKNGRYDPEDLSQNYIDSIKDLPEQIRNELFEYFRDNFLYNYLDNLEKLVNDEKVKNCNRHNNPNRRDDEWREYDAAEFYARALSKLYFSYVDFCPDDACQIAIKIKQEDLQHVHVLDKKDIKRGTSYYQIANHALSKLDESKLNEENRKRLGEWKVEMQKVNMQEAENRFCWKWPYDETPQEILKNIKEELSLTKEFTPEIYEKFDNIIIYFNSIADKIVKKRTIDKNPRSLSFKYNNNIDDIKNLSEMDLTLDENITDFLINEVIKKTNNIVLAGEAYSIIWRRNNDLGSKIAFACVGLDPFKNIVDHACSISFDFPNLNIRLALLCAEQADTSDVHKEMAEKIWNDRRMSGHRTLFLEGCAKIHNKYSQDKLTQALEHLKDHLNLIFIAAECGNNLLTKEGQIDHANKAWAFYWDPKSLVGFDGRDKKYDFPSVPNKILEAYKKASGRNSPELLIQELVKEIEAPTGIIKKENAFGWLNWLFTSFSKDLDSSRVLLERCQYSSNPEVVEFAKEKSQALSKSSDENLKDLGEKMLRRLEKPTEPTIPQITS